MEDRYTFTGETVASYLQKNDSVYGQYVDLLNSVTQSSKTESTIFTLLSVTTSHYTCFAPTNQAIDNFLDSAYAKGVFPSKDFAVFLDSVRAGRAIGDSLAKEIVYNSIIDCGSSEAYETGSFPDNNGTFAQPNLKDRYLTSYNETKNSDHDYYILEDVKIIEANIEVENGYIHGVNKVVSPTNAGVADLFADIDNMQLFGTLLQKTGWSQAISADNYLDDEYEQIALDKNLEDEMPEILASTENKSTAYVPEHRKYGFTVFAETDDVLTQELNLQSPNELVDKLMAYLKDKYSDMDGVTFDTSDSALKKADNAINQFVAYHLLPVSLPSNQLVFHYNEKDFDLNAAKNGQIKVSIPVYEFYETMSMPGGPRRLLKIYQSKNSGGVRLNRKPVMDTESYEETGYEVEGVLVGGKSGDLSSVVSAMNGFVYPIDRILVYTNSETAKKVLRDRIRIDAAALVPELINIGYRRPYKTINGKRNVFFPQDFKTVNIQRSQYTVFSYLSGTDMGWSDYQGDEFIFKGNYDVTLKLPPVPFSGTYEIRWAISGNTKRGMCQVYFGKEGENLTPVDIPMDLRMTENWQDPESAGLVPLNVGWEQETDDENYNYLVNKALRNNKWMKGPRYYKSQLATEAGSMAYNNPAIVRKIVTQETLEPGETYYLRFKSALEDQSTEFYFDYIEIVPAEVYNNTAELEDEW